MEDDLDSFFERDSKIIKHLIKKNPQMSKDEAKIEAKRIWQNYCEQNKERDNKREQEHRRQFDEDLKWESYNTFFEYLDNFDSND